MVPAVERLSAKSVLLQDGRKKANVHARLAVIRGISANIRREKIENRAVTIESSRRGRIRQIEAKALTATRAPAGSS